MQVRESKPLHVLAVGEVLWDIFSDGEVLGGAALNFCANISRLGGDACLLSAVGADQRGRKITAAMQALGLSTDFVSVTTSAETGVAHIRSLEDGETAFHIPRPAAFDFLHAGVSIEKLPSRIDWIYFGTLLQCTPAAEEFIVEVLRRYPDARTFYDLNLRTGHWNWDLVQRSSRHADILKLNLKEAEMLSELNGTAPGQFDLEGFCRRWSELNSIETICVTLGPDGCFIYGKGISQTFAGMPAQVHDTVGAGDAFAAAFLYGYNSGWSMQETARLANAAGAIVASRAGATPEWSYAECLTIAGAPDM